MVRLMTQILNGKIRLPHSPRGRRASAILVLSARPYLAPHIAQGGAVIGHRVVGQTEYRSVDRSGR